MCVHYIRDSKYDKACLATMHMYTASIELPPHVIAFGYYSRLFVFVEMEWKMWSKVFYNNAAGGRNHLVHTVQSKRIALCPSSNRV
jgi:hypothetical protein